MTGVRVRVARPGLNVHSADADDVRDSHKTRSLEKRCCEPDAGSGDRCDYKDESGGLRAASTGWCEEGALDEYRADEEKFRRNQRPPGGWQNPECNDG
ncbi:hypothetical protein GCM10008995_02740 [Halobellus salinus]|uniref:Uncharacterized protein n=1 Tax=Halobellus salinus TaxID=931585 RepID=A0A830EJV4_9EURY|nr:hypothetical protein GCM10008995_02740 [Halobellus salinus]